MRDQAAARILDYHLVGCRNLLLAAHLNLEDFGRDIGALGTDEVVKS